jgi:hypothetical protein
MLALLLAGVGLCGVAYAVSLQRTEIGIRKLSLVIGRGVALAAAGAALGVIGAAWLTRLMESSTLNSRID